ncbi:MAG: polysaccharide biosynthesis/export family protein, partial [Candidatus Deferrimicrobiaceae bacterium]
MGNPPLLVQTDVQNEKSSPSDIVPPVIAYAKSPPPTPPEKTPALVTTTAHIPLPAIPKNTPAPVAEPIKSPAAAAPEKEPATVIASIKPTVHEQSAPNPVPPVSHQMTLKKEAVFQTASRETPSSLPTPPPSAQGKKKSVATDFSGGPKYRIGPEDVLHVDVWGNPELTRDVTVRPDGKISLPLIQDIQAEGLTAAELSDGIQQKLLAYLKGP